MTDDRVILHADMDAFYASIEQRDRPELRGRPVIVGGLSDRGVVSAASYEARRYGVHSAMPTAEARRRCPDGVFLRGDMKKYGRESRKLFEIFRRFTPRVEGLSLDEAFLDLTGSERLLGSARSVGKELRASVRAELGLTVSVGIAATKMVAKIASAAAKPDGHLEVEPGRARAFLDPLPVGRLWGVGPVAERRLQAAGFTTIGQLARAEPEELRARLGSFGANLARLARGDDPRPVDPGREPVSLSEENTFEHDVVDRDRLAATLLEHADSVARRLRRAGLRARTVVLKAKLARRRASGRYGHPQLTRRATLAEPSDDGARIAEAASTLLARLPAEPVRLLGVGVTNLVHSSRDQLALFDAAPGGRRRERLNQALDAITSRFGARAVVRGGGSEPERAGLALQAKPGDEDDEDRSPSRTP